MLTLDELRKKLEEAREVADEAVSAAARAEGKRDLLEALLTAREREEGK